MSSREKVLLADLAHYQTVENNTRGQADDGRGRGRGKERSILDDLLTLAGDQK